MALFAKVCPTAAQIEFFKSYLCDIDHIDNEKLNDILTVKMRKYILTLLVFLFIAFGLNIIQTDSKTKILYAKQVNETKTYSRNYPTYKIYESSLLGKKKEIFSVGDTKNYPLQISFIKNKNLFLVNLEHSLLVVDRLTGKKSMLFSGDKTKDYIFGHSVSHDTKKLALNVSNGAYRQGERVFKIIVINLDTGSQETILSRAIIDDTFWLTPQFWSKNDKKIYMYEAYPGEGSSRIWVVNEDGSNLVKLPITFGEESPDGSKYAYTGFQKVTWGCRGLANFPLKIYDLITGNEIVVGDDPDKSSSFSTVDWSPDSKELLYTKSRYKSGEGCLAQFYPEETFIYDTQNGESKNIESKEKQLKAWSPDKPEVQENRIEAFTKGELEELKVNGKIMDKVSQSGFRIFYIDYF